MILQVRPGSLAIKPRRLPSCAECRRRACLCSTGVHLFEASGSFKGMPCSLCSALAPCALTQQSSDCAYQPSPAKSSPCRELGGGDLPAGGAWAWAAGAEAVRWARSAVWSRAFNLRCLGMRP